MMQLARGAEPIAKARQQRMRPAEMLIVSLIGRTGEANHTIHASPEALYDWRCLHDLDVCVYARSSVNWKHVMRGIAACRPRWLGLWDVDRFTGFDVSFLPDVRDIEKPKSQWRWNLDLLPWLAFQNENFAFGDE